MQLEKLVKLKMKKNILFVALFTTLLLCLNGCVTIKYSDQAVTDFPKSAEYIDQIKDDTILVALPMYEEEENIYRRAIKYGKNDIKKNKERLLNLKKDRAIEVKETISAFEENFHFAKILYIPDSLVHNFENGEERSFFLDNDGELDNSIKYNNRTPIKIIQPSDYSWTVVQGDDLLPNPFPNYYSYKNGLVIFLGLAPHSKLVDEMTKTFQERFERFHSNPSRRLYY